MGARLALNTVAAAVAAVVLAPLARPGYLLTYDMNFVPAQPLRLDLIAPVQTAPRAVPLDAAVSLLNTIMQGWLLQRVILVAIIWAAVVGAGRLVPTESTPIRVVAGLLYGWSPFLAERLLLGQWGLLIAYAVLPWLVLALWRRNWPAIVLCGALCALTPTGGLIAALVSLAMLPWRRWAPMAAIIAVVNSPWWIAALVTQAGSHSDPAGVQAFAARAENWAGPLVALLGTGGIWNRETTPASRGSVLIPLLTLGLLLLAIFGYAAKPRQVPKGLVIGAGAGLALAMASTVHIGTIQFLTEHVPGAGLLRDAQKFVMPYALLLAVCVALGVERIAAKLPADVRPILLTGAMLLPVMAMPDLAFGAAGTLRPVHYPPDWAAVARIVDAEPGEILSLPLSEYRSYAWNRNRVVIDPAGRYFGSPVIADDRLVVDGRELAGEDPRLAGFRARLRSGEPVASGEVRWVLIQHRGDVTQAVPATALHGLRAAYTGDHLALYRDPTAAGSSVEVRRHLPILISEILVLLLMIGSIVMMAVAARR